MAILKVRKPDGSIQEIQTIVGPRGATGPRGAAFTYEDFTQEQLDGLKVKGDAPVKGVDYRDGIDGQDGHSPVVTAVKTSGTTKIKVDGTTVAIINDGTNGSNGNGIASVATNDDYTLTITFTDGTSYTTPVLKGEKGDSGSAALTDELDFVLEKGNINTDGSDNNSGTYMTTNIRSKGFVELTRDAAIHISIPEESNLKMWFFDENKTKLGVQTNCSESVTPETGTKYIRFRVQKADGFDTSPNVRVYQYTTLGELNADIAELAQLKPSETPTAGKLLKVRSVNDDGSFVCEWADAPSGSSTDVQINGTSITEDGVANIPSNVNDAYAVGKYNSNYGIAFRNNNSGYLKTVPAFTSNIDTRTGSLTSDSTSTNRPITPNNLDYAVKAALTDGVGAAYTSAEQSAARQRLGAEKEHKFELIEEINVNSADALSSVTRTSEPDGTPYKFSNVIVVSYTTSTRIGSTPYCRVGSNGVYTIVYMSNTTKNSIIDVDIRKPYAMSHNKSADEGYVASAVNYSILNQNGNIDSILIGASSGTISDGTTFKIYAIRA